MANSTFAFLEISRYFFPNIFNPQLVEFQMQNQGYEEIQRATISCHESFINSDSLTQAVKWLNAALLWQNDIL